jgi:CelD/BcsL family acetyltransferase involved in cellulose biosynthesis
VNVHAFDPLVGSRWREFINGHPHSSAFHSAEWATALRRTYGYEPIVYTTSPPGEQLANGILFCRVRSWLTGNRLVSLPFSDHCEPLVDSEADRRSLVDGLVQIRQQEQLKYVELRPRRTPFLEDSRVEPASSYRFHVLDLNRSADELLQSFHKSTIQRKIRRADRENLRLETGRSDRLLNAFYDLLLLTRRRHRLPPQPPRWFRNLVDGFGERVAIRLASLGDRPIASILTLRHGSTLMYKYGCSDAAYHSVGAMPALLWSSILEAKGQGLSTFDLGRSDLDNTGLIQFKDRWGAQSSTVTYTRISRRPSRDARNRQGVRLAQHVVARIPRYLFVKAGQALYRHLG